VWFAEERIKRRGEERRDKWKVMEEVIQKRGNLKNLRKKIKTKFRMLKLSLFKLSIL
jgi:transposase-like protein